jgi:hypothetical protein
MKILLREARNNLIICDIQPIYSVSKQLIPKMVSKIRKFEKILYLYNGDDTGLSEDNIDSIKNWIYEYYDYDDKIINMIESKDITWYDKGYAFFRDMMDSGKFEDIQIIKVIQFMLFKNVYDIRDLDEEDFNKINKRLNLNMISSNDYNTWISEGLVKYLKQYPKGSIIGGGENECLKEIVLLSKALKLGYQVDIFVVYYRIS